MTNVINQPSEEALRRLIRFLLKTSVPRVIAKQRSEVNAHENQCSRMAGNANRKAPGTNQQRN